MASSPSLSTHEPAGYVPAIDGMRALAVLSVLLFHLRPGLLPGGFVGVDIFFVISGFVVTRSLADRQFASLWDLLSYFYVRRLLRIIPALLVMLLVSVAAFVAFVPESWLSSTSAKVAKGAFLGISNVVLALQTDDYFAPRPGFNPFTHTWSLGVEEQFYVVFPFLLYGHLQHKNRGGLMSPTAIAIAILSVGSLLCCAWLTSVHWPWAFYLMPARLWELGVGMLLCLTIARWQPTVARLGSVPRAILASASVGAIALALPIKASTMFPFPLGILPVVGSVLLIVQSCALPQGAAARILARPLPVGIGKRSYSLYLWHWPVFVLFRWTVGIESAWTIAAAVVLTAAAAELSYRFVELGPLRRRIARTVPRWLVISAGIGTIAVLGGTASAALNAHRELSLSRTAEAGIWYPDATKELNPALTHCRLSFVQSPFSNGQLSDWVPKACSNGEIKPGRLYVIGDSHSLAYLPMLHQYAADTGREVRSYYLSDCPYVNLKDPIGSVPVCNQYYAALSKMLNTETRAGDVLFLASLKLERLSNQWGEREPEAIAQSMRRTNLARSTEEMLALSGILGRRGVNVVVEGAKPLFRSPAFRCADWFNRSNPVCKLGLSLRRSEEEAMRAPVQRAIATVAATNGNVSDWDPFPLLCPGEQCSAFRNGKPLFIDGDHVSAYANDLLYPSFREAVERSFATAGRRGSRE